MYNKNMDNFWMVRDDGFSFDAEASDKEYWVFTQTFDGEYTEDEVAELENEMEEKYDYTCEWLHICTTAEKTGSREVTVTVEYIWSVEP